MPRIHAAVGGIDSIASGTGLLRVRASGAGLLLALGVVCCAWLPSVAGPATAAETEAAGGTVYHTRFKVDSGEGIRAAEIEGRIRFGAGGSRVEWMEPGSRLVIVTNDLGRSSRFEARPDGQGRPVVRFEVDGRARHGDSAAQWLAGTLPVLFRELGHDVESRIQETYAKGGADAVLEMIGAIRSDYSTGLHYVAFLGRPGLSDDEIAGALSRLGRDITADDELATVLYAAKDLYLERPGIRASFLACFDQFDSPTERSRMTRNLFGTDTLAGGEPPLMTALPGDC